jgi:drug/metabolite transporter (DMT)-like permease
VKWVLIMTNLSNLNHPDEIRWHTEFWIPTDKPLSIYRLKVPALSLRPVKKIPLFGWARSAEVKVWDDLRKAFKEKGTLPDLPEVHENCWPPSGMEDLKPAFEWAINRSGAGTSDMWKYYYGAWAAGRGDTALAIRNLKESGIGIAKALLSRLLRLSGDNAGAAQAYALIEDRWLQLHPQVVVERDKTLRNLGKVTLSDREHWLKEVDALNDEGIIERRIQLLIDKGDAEEARKLLLSVRFQKVTGLYTYLLWFQICDRLNPIRLPVPDQLGERSGHVRRTVNLNDRMISGNNWDSHYYLLLAGIWPYYSGPILHFPKCLEQRGPITGRFTFTCSGFVMFIIIYRQRQTEFLGKLKNLPPAYYLRTGIFFIINNVLLFLAVGMARKNEELIIVTLLNYTWPVMIYILRIPIFRLKTPMAVFIPGVLLSLTGIVLALLQDYDIGSIGRLMKAGDENFPAYLMAFLTSVSWALYSNLTVKHKNKDDMAAIPVIFMVSALIFLGIQGLRGQLSSLRCRLKHSARSSLPDYRPNLATLWVYRHENGNRTLITALLFYSRPFTYFHIRVHLKIGPVFWLP